MAIVSVLMTAYNRESYIAEAIESVCYSNYTDFELIIVDDCSTDGTCDVVEKYASKENRIKLYRNENNLGDYLNRNKAASYASGKYLKYLDSDDIMYPYGLQIMIEAMEKFPEAGFGLSCLGEPSRPYPVCISSHQAYLEHFNGYNHFDRAPGSSIISREAFERVGGFSGKRMIGDNEMWLKLARYFPMVKFQVDLYWSRQHEGQESNSNYAKQYDLLRNAVFQEAFNHPDCPLSLMEKSKITQTLRKKTFLKKVKNILS